LLNVFYSGSAANVVLELVISLNRQAARVKGAARSSALTERSVNHTVFQTGGSMFETLFSPPDPFSELDRLQRDIQQMFRGFGMPSSIRAVAHGAFPAINSGSTPGSVEIYTFAPGIDPAKLEINVDRGVLTIAGERKSDLPEESDKLTIYAAQRFAGSFRRAMTLPDDVDLSNVQARYRNGVLHISVPRRESAQPKRIEIK
jgi:HSP20 family protein